MAKKDNGWYDDQKNIDFKDSWLQNSVELAAAGAIVAGAGALAIKGDFTDALKTGRKAGGVMIKGFENYLKRNGSPAARFGYQVGKKTFFNLKKLPPHTGEEGANLLRSHIDSKVDDLDLKKLRGDVAKKLNDDGYLAPFVKGKGVNTWNDVVDDVLDNGGKVTDNHMKNKVKLLFEKAKGGQLHEDLGLTEKPKDKNKPKWFGPGKNDGSPLIDKKQLSKEMVASGLAGLSFGAGISGFHAIDRMSSDKDNQKKLEDSFQFGGSFLPKKDDKEMKKEAGALDFYNGLKGIGKKTPEAVASGLGFTGVSLGTAKLLGDKKKKEEEEAKGTRVIIELGNPEDDTVNKAHPTPAGSLLPKFASGQNEGLAKRAFAGTFLKDFAGHSDEINKLKTMNYDEAAASQLRNADIPNLLKQQYGNLVNDKTESQFTKNLFDNRAKAIKQSADDEVTNLETRTAKARLAAGGGALAAGGGLAGLAYHNKEEKNV